MNIQMKLRFLKCLYILCENKPYFDQELNVTWYVAYIDHNKNSDYKYCLDIYRKYKARMRKYNKPEKSIK